MQVAACIENDSHKKMLITGGGAFNTYLIQRMAAHTTVRFIIPDHKIINYKEALVFAFLGLLRLEAKANCLATVTGASRDISGGAIYLP
jgi:anhydro-N-acetylmuramic acid kinase